MPRLCLIETSPTTVSSAKNIKNDPAKYISWLCNAEINIGPVVGRDSTIETIAEPETIWGSILPISAMKGFNEALRGYLSNAATDVGPCFSRNKILLLELV